MPSEECPKCKGIIATFPDSKTCYCIKCHCRINYGEPFKEVERKQKENHQLPEYFKK